MFLSKKIYILLFSFFILIILFYVFPPLSVYSYINPVLSAGETDKDLMELLKKSNSKEERKKIFEAHRNLVTEKFVIDLIAGNSVNMKNISLKEPERIAGIALEAAEFTGNQNILARALLYYSNFELTEAKNYTPPSLQKALSLFLQSWDRKGEGACYYRQAVNLFYVFSVPDKALECADKAQNIFKETEDRAFEGECYYLKGQIYHLSGDKDKAIENFNCGVEIFKDSRDIRDITTLLSCYQEMTDTCRSLGFLEESDTYLERKRAVIETLNPEDIDFSGKEEGYIFRNTEFNGKEKLMADYYNSRGSLYTAMGKYEEAIKNFKRTIEICEKNKISSKISPYWYLGGIYSLLGKKDMALKYYLEGINKNEGDIYSLILNYILAGRFYCRDMKDPEKAIQYYKTAMSKSEEIIMEEAKEQFKGLSMKYMAQAYEETGEYDKAIENIKEAIKIFEKPYKDYGQINELMIWSYSILGDLYEKKGNKEQAFICIEKAIEFAEKAGKPVNIIRAYGCAGKVYFNTGDFEKALKCHSKALTMAEDMHDPLFLWECYFYTGKTYEKLGNNQEAYKAYGNAIDVIENTRQEFKIEDLKSDFMQDKTEVYEHMIDLLIKMKREKDAFNYNEKARARAFLDLLANRKIIHHGVKEEVMKKEEELKRRMESFSRDIRQEKGKPVMSQRNGFIVETDEKIKNLKREYEELLEEIKLENPEYMSFISVNPLTEEEIKSLLDRDSAIIEYFPGENKSYVWVIGSDSFHTVTLEYNRKKIESLVREYREIICNNMTMKKLKDPSWHEEGKKIYNILLKDIEAYIKDKKRILIVPHGSLHYLPFQILADNKGNMLVEKFDISYLPSASVLKYCERKNTLKKEKLLAFELGNFKAEDLSPLPGTEKEVNSIASFFPKKEIYADKDMKTDILYKEGVNYDILHFATHSILDGTSPMFTSIVFADRRLPVYEIFDLNLKSYLVCLSGCRTGLGEEANGDELVALSRAFIYAGTPSICASLWDVSDVATPELMERFYYYLKNNNKSEALKLAQLELMKKYPHPFFWAPFVLTGDWR
ncbi:MAG: CHAT domain-containing tetratricopeptide repeat protein [Candidatus Eremiobacterota bacterium]